MKPFLKSIRLTTNLLALRICALAPATRNRGARVEFANIGEGTEDRGVKAYLPDAQCTNNTRYLLYKTSATDANHCTPTTGNTDVPLGPSDDSPDPNNLDVPIAINLLGAVRGTVRVVSDGTLVNGAHVCASAVTAGYAAAATSATTVSFGIAVVPTDATAFNGDVVEMIPSLPAKYSF